jgi:hypothetical protein
MRIEYAREQAAVGLIPATVEDWMALDLFAGIPVTDYAGARRAGNALVLSFVDDLDDRVAEVTRRGIEPAKREKYDSGATKVTYRDTDGNEISLGGQT